MRKHSYKGKLICFEGLDGSGSSTQAGLLYNYLVEKKEKVVVTKEPTNNLIGGLIRGQLTGEWSAPPECLNLLFAADRMHHIWREVEPALEGGRIVIVDRYILSALAYGAASMPGREDWLAKINETAIEPDLCFLLKVKPKTAIRRLKRRAFSLELFEEEKKLAKVWQEYQKLSEVFPWVRIVDGERDIEAIHREVIKIVDRIIK